VKDFDGKAVAEAMKAMEQSLKAKNITMPDPET
jgi:hypothetical protein